MSKKTTKANQSKDPKPVVLLPFSQQYNSQDSLFNENDGILNSQYANNLFSKPNTRDNIQFTVGSGVKAATANNALNIPNSIFNNEWENDVPVQKQKNQKGYVLSNSSAGEMNQFESKKNLNQQHMDMEEEEEEDEEDMYEPEALLDKRVINGQVEYLVKWVEFSEDNSTWEPVESIQICAFDLIQLYEEQQRRGGARNDNARNRGSRSPILTPSSRRQMPSPNLSRNHNLSQLSGKSPIRKIETTPQPKSGMRQKESAIITPTHQYKSGSVSPYQSKTPPTAGAQSKRGNVQSTSSTATFDQIPQERQQFSKTIQNEKDSRLFDHQSERNQISPFPKSQKRDFSATPKNTSYINNKMQQESSQEKNVRQVFNAEGEIIFEQKKIVDNAHEKYYNKSKSPLLKLVKESPFIQKTLQNSNENKSASVTPNRRGGGTQTPVNQKGAQQNNYQPKSPIGLVTPQNPNKQQGNKGNTPYNEIQNQQIELTPTPTKGRGRGRPPLNKQVEIPPSPMMTPTPDVATKSPYQQINRKKIYQEIEISDDLLKSPIGRYSSKTSATSANTKQNMNLQSPKMIFDQTNIKKSSTKKKRLLKRIEISDDESDSDIENIPCLEEKEVLEDDIVPVFEEIQRKRRGGGGNKQLQSLQIQPAKNTRSSTISASDAPVRKQGLVTPNAKNNKTPVQNSKLDQTPTNKLQDLTPIRDVLKNYKNVNQRNQLEEEEEEEDSIMDYEDITPIKKAQQKPVITPNKQSIWSYNKSANKQVLEDKMTITPQKKNIPQNTRTPTRSTNKSPISKKDPKSPMSKTNNEPKSALKKNNDLSPISKTMEDPNNSKRKRKRQFSSISDEEPTPISIRGDNTPVRQDSTPLRSSNQMDLTPTRRSTRSRDDKQQQPSVTENEQAQRSEKEDMQSLKESYQVHMKLRENRVQLQTQTDKINNIWQQTKDNLSTLSQMKFTVQKELHEDLFTRVAKKANTLMKQKSKGDTASVETIDQQAEVNSKNQKQTNFETPKKANANTTQKQKTPESKSKNSRQGSSKKKQKIDPKANLKKHNQRSASKENTMEIEDEQQLTGKSKKPITNEKNSETNDKEKQPSKDSDKKDSIGAESGEKGDLNEDNQQTPNTKTRRGQNKKEEKIDQKKKEKNEKLANSVAQNVADNNPETVNAQEQLLVTPQQDNKRRSSRLSNKEEKTPSHQEKEQDIKNNSSSTPVTTRRGQQLAAQQEKADKDSAHKDSLITPEKQKTQNSKQQVDPKARSNKNNNAQKENVSLSTDNTPMKDITNKNQNEKKDGDLNSKQNTDKKHDEKVSKNSLSSQKQNNISKIISLISQKKQKRGSKSLKTKSDYPTFMIEYENGKCDTINYIDLVEIQPKMIADFLIQDYM